MSDDLVNKITLNCLISKSQLHKLNKKLRNDSDKKKIEEMQKYRSRVEDLFKEMLDGNAPDDLLLDIKYAYDAFIEKSIYYFKLVDNANMLENRRRDIKDDIKNDIDFDKEERQIENGNYTEHDDDAELSDRLVGRDSIESEDSEY